MSLDETTRAGVRAAITLAETVPWDELTLAAIAEAAGLGLKDFHAIADKDEISRSVEAWLDEAMSEGCLDDEETARSRLFDVLMMRFDAMEAHRDGVLSFLRWRDRSLAGLALRVKARAETARWALACAGLDKAGRLPRGVRLAGLGWAIAQAERAWRQETSPDLTRTMAALDGELIKAEERAGWLTGSWRRPTRGASEDTDEDET
jgi:hypothetical protein